MAVVAVAAWIVAESFTEPLTHRRFQTMMRAAVAMRSAMPILRAERERLGIEQPLAIDPNQTGMVGSEFTSITTTLGILEAKRTATNPDLAAALVRLLDEYGVDDGDRVAITASGSIVGGNVAAIAAVEAVGADLMLISSLGASMYGATDPELTWLDIEALLRANGVIAAHTLLAVAGGARGMAPGMDASGREAVMAAAERTQTPIAEADRLDQLVEILQDALLANGPIDMLINIGGAVIALGSCIEGAELPVGLSHEELPCDGQPGLMVRLSRQGVPIVHILNIRAIAAAWGLPYDPIPLPRPGDNRRIYGGALFPSL